MKLFLAFLAILGFAAADDLSELKTFLSCLDKAIQNGIPAIHLPSHNPLPIQNFTFSGGNSLTGSYSMNITGNFLHDLLNYTFPVLDVAKTYSNPDIIVYDYEIYWPQLNFTGDWEFEYKSLLLSTNMSGTYNIVMSHLAWSGIFNLTKPGQTGYDETVNAFTLSSTVKDVEVILDGISTGETAIEQALRGGLIYLLNNFPTQAAEFLRTERFNGFWIGHPEKIQAVMEFCGLSY